MDDTIYRQAAIDAIGFGITYARAINKETGEVKELFQESNNELRKAVERVKELPSAQQGRYMVTTDESTDLDILKGIINKPSDITLIPLPKAEPRWIPCSERLPERGVSVLVSHVGYVSEDYLDIDDGAMYFWNSGIDLDEELNNLAWMPLPAPWKGEDE